MSVSQILVMYISSLIDIAFNLMIIFVYVFILHVLITCLNVVFIKTCAYTYTISELHLIIVFECLIAIVYLLHVFV